MGSHWSIITSSVTQTQKPKGNHHDDGCLVLSTGLGECASAQTINELPVVFDKGEEPPGPHYDRSSARPTGRGVEQNVAARPRRPRGSCQSANIEKDLLVHIHELCSQWMTSWAAFHPEHNAVELIDRAPARKREKHVRIIPD